MMRVSGGRLPYDQLFYDENSKKRISENALISADLYLKEFLFALRSGPSAIIQQPWRFVLDGNQVHLFDAKRNSYLTWESL